MKDKNEDIAKMFDEVEEAIESKDKEIEKSREEIEKLEVKVNELENLNNGQGKKRRRRVGFKQIAAISLAAILGYGFYLSNHIVEGSLIRYSGTINVPTETGSRKLDVVYRTYDPSFGKLSLRGREANVLKVKYYGPTNTQVEFWDVDADSYLDNDEDKVILYTSKGKVTYACNWMINEQGQKIVKGEDTLGNAMISNFKEFYSDHFKILNEIRKETGKDMHDG